MTPSPTAATDPARAAYDFVDSMLPRADIQHPFPAWHGWALREAFAAGVAWERARCLEIANSLELCGQGISTAIEHEETPQ